MVRTYKVFQDFFSGSGEIAYQNEVTFMANEEAYLKSQLEVLTPRLQAVESRRENTVKNQNKICGVGKEDAGSFCLNTESMNTTISRKQENINADLCFLSILAYDVVLYYYIRLI